MIQVLSLKDNSTTNYESIEDILQDFTELKKEAVMNCLKGQQGSHKGYKFSFLDEVTPEVVVSEAEEIKSLSAQTQTIEKAQEIQTVSQVNPMESNLAECDFALPTRGLFNPDLPKVLPIRTFTSGEEMKLLSSTTNNAIFSILNNIVLIDGFNIKDLVLADIVALSVKARIHTFGTEYYLDSYCPFCEYEGTIRADLDNLETHFIEDIKLPLKLRLPVSQKEVTLRVLTHGHHLAIEDRLEKLKQNTYGGDIEVLKATITRAKQISSIDGKEVLSPEAEKFVRNAHPQDLAYIDSALSSIAVGISKVIKVKCPKCGKEIIVPFTMNSTFFRPVYSGVQWL